MAKENYGLELFMDVTYTVSKFGFLRAATVSLLLAGASSPVSAEELPFQTYFVGQWVIIFFMAECRNWHIPEDSSEVRLKMKMHRPVYHGFHPKDVAFC